MSHAKQNRAKRIVQVNVQVQDQVKVQIHAAGGNLGWKTNFATETN